jgi:hypothetical protein
MSWSISSRGRAKDVAAEVSAHSSVPQPIKDLVSLFAQGAQHKGEGMEVVTHGHHGGKGASIGSAELKITALNLASQVPDEPEIVPPQPDPNAPTGHVGVPTVPGEPNHPAPIAAA